MAAKEDAKAKARKKTAGDEAKGGRSAEGNPAEGGRAETNDNIDRLGVLLSKGLDLVETGLELGVNLASKLGSAAQEKVSETLRTRRENAAAHQSSRPSAAAEPGASPTRGQAADQGEGESTASVVYNRLPVTPGHDIKASFSIENESTDGDKNVAIAVGPVFTGQKSGYVIDGESVSVHPSTASIGPMDFEKFVLRTTIPAEAPPDTYQGCLIVAGAEEYQIPVALIVGPPDR